MIVQAGVEVIGDKIERGLAVCVYSDPGKGKTTLAATLPVGKTLFITFEAGDGPLLGTGHRRSNMNLSAHCPNDSPEEYHRWLEILEERHRMLLTQKHEYKYVVLDNISEMEVSIQTALQCMRNKEFPELKEYGDAAIKMREFLKLYCDLTHKKMTVIFNAWEMQFEIKNIGGEVITKGAPKIGKTLVPGFCGIVDIVARLEVHEKSGKRWLRIGPSSDYITKCQFEGLDSGEVANLPAILEKIYAYDYKKERAAS